MRPRPVLTALLACAAGAVLLGGCANGATPELGRPEPPSITTRGVGTVQGTPDTLTVALGVQTRAASAADALAENTTRTTGLLDVLRRRGVADADLRTSRLSIDPTYDQNGGITGYAVTNEVTATLRDLSGSAAGAGALVDAAAQATGDAARVDRIAFAIDDDAEPRARARGDAVRQAVTQARQLAEAANVTLGPILSITEVTAGEPPQPAARDSAVAASAAVPIQPGTQDVSVTVEVVHAVGT